MSEPIEIFFSFAHEDEDLMHDVRRQLVVYEINGRIIKWDDRMIPAGTGWREEIANRVEKAQIILLFMSPHFIESEYCYEVEGAVALRKLQANEARVLPIILRPCAWEDTNFGNLQALPTGAKPITRWEDRDEACLNVARGIMEVVDELTKQNRASTAAAPAPQPPASSAIVYCSRCGGLAGERTYCTGQYTHHDFARGSTGDYCSRCGASAGAKSYCSGQYTHHSFTRRE